MPKIAQFAKFVTKPGETAAVRQALENAAAAARLEPGTLVYALHESQDDPATLWMYELYASTEDQQAHSSSLATAQLRAEVADRLLEPLAVIRAPSLFVHALPGASE
jgi:quinol monooxygenase YgiN